MGERKPFEPTNEVVKDAACWQRRRLGEPRGVDPKTYDRWLAGVRAEALRDAAEHVIEIDGRRDDAAAGWLRSRADHIEALA